MSRKNFQENLVYIKASAPLTSIKSLKKKIEVLEVEKSQLETIAKDVEILKRKYNKIKV